MEPAARKAIPMSGAAGEANSFAEERPRPGGACEGRRGEATALAPSGASMPTDWGNRDDPDLTPEEEAVLIATLPPPLLIDLLRSLPDVADRVFAGFRPNPRNLALALVQRRLHQESASHPLLKRCLWDLWQETHAPLLSEVERLEDPELQAKLPGLVDEWGPDRVGLTLRAGGRKADVALPQAEPEAPRPVAPERDRGVNSQLSRLREQVRALRAEKAQQRRESARLRGQLDAALRLAEKREAAATEATHEAAELRRSAERSTRQVARLQQTKGDLEIRLQEATRAQRRLASEVESLRRQEEERARARADRRATMPAGEAWLRAARDLARHGEAQSAVSLLARVIREHPNSPPVREALAEAHQASGALPDAAAELCWLARWKQQRGSTAEATGFACRALAILPEDTGTQRCAKEILASLDPGDRDAWERIEVRLGALEKESPAAYRILTSLLPAPQRRVLAAARRESARLDLDRPISWPEEDGAFPASLRSVIEAVDANRSDIVDRVRRALSLLEAREPQRYRAIMKALREHDESYRTILVRRPQPVVVDGSNVAWYGLDGAGPPRFQHLIAMRRELYSLGYFPIHVYVDAALLHQIDERAALARLVSRREVQVADPGTDADEQILRDARDLDCAVVTNDWMLEHDPSGRVRKMRFDIDPQGASIRDWHQHL